MLQRVCFWFWVICLAFGDFLFLLRAMQCCNELCFWNESQNKMNPQLSWMTKGMVTTCCWAWECNFSVVCWPMSQGWWYCNMADDYLNKITPWLCMNARLYICFSNCFLYKPDNFRTKTNSTEATSTVKKEGPKILSPWEEFFLGKCDKAREECWFCSWARLGDRGGRVMDKTHGHGWRHKAGLVLSNQTGFAPSLAALPPPPPSASCIAPPPSFPKLSSSSHPPPSGQRKGR